MNTQQISANFGGPQEKPSDIVRIKNNHEDTEHNPIPMTVRDPASQQPLHFGPGGVLEVPLATAYALAQMSPRFNIVDRPAAPNANIAVRFHGGIEFKSKPFVQRYGGIPYKFFHNEDFFGPASLVTFFRQKLKVQDPTADFILVKAENKLIQVRNEPPTENLSPGEQWAFLKAAAKELGVNSIGRSKEELIVEMLVADENAARAAVARTAYEITPAIELQAAELKDAQLAALQGA